MVLRSVSRASRHCRSWQGRATRRLVAASPHNESLHIRELRSLATQMNQVELAERIGVTKQPVIGIEQGRYSPSLEVAFKMARVFGVSLDEVFGYPPEL